MEQVTTGYIRRMTDTEGLILQGCGGNPDEWLSGINELLTKEGILRDGDTFKEAYVFEHDGLTNILFSMENVKLDIGKLAMWRITSHGTFGGTWLSDYIPNRLGLDNADHTLPTTEPDKEPVEEAPPIVALGERPSPYRDGFYNDGPRSDDGERETVYHPLSVYIENARDDGIGGFTMPLPATTEELRPFLEKAEINNGQDVKVWEVSSDIKGLGEVLEEAASVSESPEILNELNYLAAKIEAMRPAELAAFSAAVEAKRHCGSIAEIINLTVNLDRFDIQPAFDATQYGAFHMNMARDEYAEVMNRLEASSDPVERDFYLHVASAEMHIDLKAYGRSIAEDEGGVFTKQGYLTESTGFRVVYRGPEDIPDWYLVVTSVERSQEQTSDELQQEFASGIKEDVGQGVVLSTNTEIPESQPSSEKPSVLERLAAARDGNTASPERDTMEKPMNCDPVR